MGTYVKYKDSGISWIGQIPDHWTVMRLKHAARIVLGKMLCNNPPDNSLEDYSLEKYLKSRNIGQLRLLAKEDDVEEMWFSESEKQLYKLHKGDVVTNEGGDIGKVGLWNENYDCYIQNSVHKITPKIGYDSRYIMYYINMAAGKDYFLSIVSQVSIAHLTKEKLSNTPFLAPEFEEQKSIADYLDSECKKIDVLIEKEGNRIELLKEARLSIVTKAVLQGLRSDVEMTPSKHVWLGSVPSHWTIMPLRYTANAKGCCFIDGDWIESKDIDYGGSIKYLTTGNVGPGYYKEQGSGYITEDKFKELDCFDVLPGDLLISRLNEPIARTCIVPDLESRVVTAVDNVIFRPNPKILDRKFACYYLNNGKLTEHANIIARGATMHRISRTMLGHLPIVLPPLDEQRDIVAFLDKECAQYDTSIARANHQIDLLKEYKQSLITEVVTGKRKVC